MRRNTPYDRWSTPIPPQRTEERRPAKPTPWYAGILGWLLVVLLLFVIVAWIAQPLRPAVNWIEVMEALRVPQGSRERYTQLAMLGVLICAGLAACRTIIKR